MTQRSRILANSLIPAALILAACQSAPDEPAAETAMPSVEAVSAGIRVVELPSPFRVVVNEPDRFELDSPTHPGSRVRVTLGGSQSSGLNIVEIVKQELAAFEALPDGESFGQTQLVAPIGLAYMVRGRHSAEGATVEELKALVVHPWGNRLLTVAYSYPAGDDTSERGGELMELLGEIEALEAASDAAPEG